jgi:hypothetical protein
MMEAAPVRGPVNRSWGRDHGAVRRAVAHEDHAARVLLRMQESVKEYAEEVRLTRPDQEPFRT